MKGRSRVVALADYTAEKSFILRVPHRVLLGRRRRAASCDAQIKASAETNEATAGLPVLDRLNHRFR